ncbi:hypothetical protein K458DRAFT_406751 [Lentithecium fluviatile CBS 122367]|uniref:Uncharacterized protein n=1 Tax=Lentithecium fluviatile CBS 122367 TaxID=1168545 RepID=A0A6G1IRV9_9PLEO|nr:hypothetical protein K458DRAFT_406751 [Lentithecium fluviatile CBS 122367]
MPAKRTSGYTLHQNGFSRCGRREYKLQTSCDALGSEITLAACDKHLVAAGAPSGQAQTGPASAPAMSSQTCSTPQTTSLALTLFSFFGEGHTERADLRPLGPDPNNITASPVEWLMQPLGEEVVADGFDIRVPREWKGTFQAAEFRRLEAWLRELNQEAWVESGSVEGAPGDLEADDRGVELFGWV